jgi:hypothetical protein
VGRELELGVLGLDCDPPGVGLLKNPSKVVWRPAEVGVELGAMVVRKLYVGRCCSATEVDVYREWGERRDCGSDILITDGSSTYAAMQPIIPVDEVAFRIASTRSDALKVNGKRVWYGWPGSRQGWRSINESTSLLLDICIKQSSRSTVNRVYHMRALGRRPDLVRGIER